MQTNTVILLAALGTENKHDVGSGNRVPFLVEELPNSMLAYTLNI